MGDRDSSVRNSEQPLRKMVELTRKKGNWYDLYKEAQPKRVVFSSPTRSSEKSNESEIIYLSNSKYPEDSYFE